MNKQEELKYKIKVHEGAISLSTDILSSLRAELAEAEKPKLRHGDWWYTCGKRKEVRVYLKEYNGEKRDCVALRCTLITNIGSEYEGQPIQGNIFDLLEERNFNENG